ncbi:hypothetical protein KFE25_005585 [Diacronema lutheri]|uniref:protein acetyllysine N-acetyltransferase n=1 Tax=Diacronema lutheri TaxID=2081491 RepID=A0A8J5XV66_DIALT|nr:hypothetical protein KFE25_005585 [Diacronema lutheri]
MLLARCGAITPVRTMGDGSLDGSLGYASRLSHRDDLGGGLGAREFLDSTADALAKSDELARLLAAAHKIVVFTGAGISTSCGIPDFRGPAGVWTLQRKGQPAPKASVRFDQAHPSLTHMVLVGMHRAGRLALVVSQNVDCLHIRSGLPRDALAELHGNCFLEVCAKCTAEYVRDFEVPSVGLKPTGRACERCAGALRDHCLDWESELPVAEMARAEAETASADVALCLGTSLQITPACNMPQRVTRRGGKLAIVNLQRTPKDGKAAIVVRARVDAVMARVARALGIDVPPYVRRDRVRVRRVLLECGRRSELRLASVHGVDAPLHWLERCTATITPTVAVTSAVPVTPVATVTLAVRGARDVAGARTGAPCDAEEAMVGAHAAPPRGCSPDAPPSVITLSAACGWRAELPAASATAGALHLSLYFELSPLCTLRSIRMDVTLPRPAADVPPSLDGARGAVARRGAQRASRPAAEADEAVVEALLELETVRVQHDADAVIAAADAEIAAAAEAGHGAANGQKPQLVRAAAKRKMQHLAADPANKAERPHEPREPALGASRSSVRQRSGSRR